MDDAALIEAARAGDEAAFGQLVRRHRQRVWRVCRSVVRRPEQADEAAQDALLKAWKGLDGFQGDASFTTWLHRIARNAALDLLAREGTQEKVRREAERAGERAPVERPAAPRALESLLQDEQRGALRAAIARLPERQRLTLVLRVQHDLTFPEIAETLGCAVGTAKANFHHAVKGLRRWLVPSSRAAATRSACDDAPRSTGLRVRGES